MPWPALLNEESPDVAIMCVGRGSSFVSELLGQHQWRLLPIESNITIALQHPTLRALSIESSDYPGIPLPPKGVPTVSTTAFLAVRKDAPGELVRAALDVIYEPPQVFVGLIPRERAAEWQGLAFHPEAWDYFAEFKRKTE